MCAALSRLLVINNVVCYSEASKMCLDGHKATRIHRYLIFCAGTQPQTIQCMAFFTQVLLSFEGINWHNGRTSGSQKMNPGCEQSSDVSLGNAVMDFIKLGNKAVNLNSI